MSRGCVQCTFRSRSSTLLLDVFQQPIDRRISKGFSATMAPLPEVDSDYRFPSVKTPRFQTVSATTGPSVVDVDIVLENLRALDKQLRSQILHQQEAVMGSFIEHVIPKLVHSIDTSKNHPAFMPTKDMDIRSCMPHTAVSVDVVAAEFSVPDK